MFIEEESESNLLYAKNLPFMSPLTARPLQLDL
jgi:hypothetical protein